MINYLCKAGRSILDFLFPIYCAGCKKEKTHCCEECALKIERRPEPVYCHPEPVPPQRDRAVALIEGWQSPSSCEKIDALFSAANFCEKSLLATLIHRYKYDGAQELAEFFASLFPENLPELLPKNKKILVPVPLHWLRFNFRGFNQSELLAHALAEKFTMHFEVQNLLKRNRNTKPQAQLKREQRMKNVESAFLLKNPDKKPTADAIYIIVDDVFTTGSTMNECAKTLKSNGAREVFGLTIAKAV